MLSTAANLLSALDSREITPEEFSDAVQFLSPTAAQLAMAMLSGLRVGFEYDEYVRTRTWQLCLTFSRCAFPKN